MGRKAAQTNNEHVEAIRARIRLPGLAVAAVSRILAATIRAAEDGKITADEAAGLVEELGQALKVIFRRRRNQE